MGPSASGSFAVSVSRIGPGRVILGIAGEHEAVDRERVPAGREQLREPHVRRLAVGPLALEDVVLRAPRRPAAAPAARPRRPPSGAGARSPGRAGDSAPSRYSVLSPGKSTSMLAFVTKTPEHAPTHRSSRPALSTGRRAAPPSEMSAVDQDRPSSRRPLENVSSISCWSPAGSSSKVQVMASRCGRSISVYSPLSSTSDAVGLPHHDPDPSADPEIHLGLGRLPVRAGVNQRRITSSLVQASKTSSAGASKVRSIRTHLRRVLASPSLLSLLEILADDVEESLPARPLAFYPIRGLGKRLGPQARADACARRSPGVTTPASSSIFRCREIVGLETPRSRVASPTVAVPPLSRSTMSRRSRVSERVERIVSHFANYIECQRRRPEEEADAGAQRSATQEEWQAERERAARRRRRSSLAAATSSRGSGGSSPGCRSRRTTSSRPRTGSEVAGRALRRPLAAARLPLHVRLRPTASMRRTRDARAAPWWPTTSTASDHTSTGTT